MITTTTSHLLEIADYSRGEGYVPFKGIEIDGMVVGFRTKDRDTRRSWEAKSRVFGACDDLIADLNKLEPTYIFRTDENSTDVERVQEQIWRTWQNNCKKIAQERMLVLLGKIADAAASDPLQLVDSNGRYLDLKLAMLDGTKFSFKAGCSSCPCSPGFILGGRIMLGWQAQDVFIESVKDLTLI